MHIVKKVRDYGQSRGIIIPKEYRDVMKLGEYVKITLIDGEALYIENYNKEKEKVNE